MRLLDGIRQPGDVGEIGDIRFDDRHGTRSTLAGQSRGCFGLLHVDVTDRNSRALGGKREDDSPADVRSAAGDDHRPIPES